MNSWKMSGKEWLIFIAGCFCGMLLMIQLTGVWIYFITGNLDGKIEIKEFTVGIDLNETRMAQALVEAADLQPLHDPKTLDNDTS